MHKIAAIVVTYNRKELLIRCIDALHRQSLRPDTIIVVDNGSIDGTTDWLRYQDDLLVIHQENIGGAGGFNRGVKEAFERGYDWVWIMDDDGLPDKDCLFNLMNTALCSTDKMILFGSLVIDISNETLLAFDLPINIPQSEYLNWWFGLKKYSFTRSKKKFLDAYKKDKLGYKNLINPFNSIFLSREAIGSIGFPDKSYFIHGDEIDFMHRAFRKGIGIYLVESSIFRCSYDNNTLSKWKEQYRTRNSIINARKYLSLSSTCFYIARSLYRILKFKKYYLFKPFYCGLIGVVRNTYHIRVNRNS